MATIQNYAIPRRLYRYRSLENFDREMDSIERTYLYCARDPMEGYYGSSKVLRESDELDDVREAILDGKQRTRICCFSEVYDHELMWAHYAKKYYGVCVAFDFYNLRKFLPPGITFSRIYYNEEPPEIGRSRKQRDFDETAKMILSYKNYGWLYEREWRMFANSERVFYDRKCVSQIYIGSEVRGSSLEEIKQRLRKLKIPYQVQNLDGYRMYFDRDTEAAPKAK
jgi:Protein of unknown function (DUF2971)